MIFELYGHIDALYDCLSMTERLEERYAYLPYGPFEGRVDFDIWFETMITNLTLRTFVVINNKTNMIGGQLSLMNIVPRMGVMEIGHIHFSPLISKSVITTEAIYLCLKYIFNDLKYRRCEWKCNHANQPSGQAAMRFGFSFEGVFRQHLVVKGKNRDTGWYAMLDFQWNQCIENGYQTFLNDINFIIQPDANSDSNNNDNGKKIQIAKLADCIGKIPLEM